MDRSSKDANDAIAVVVELAEFRRKRHEKRAASSATHPVARRVVWVPVTFRAPVPSPQPWAPWMAPQWR